MVSVQFHIAQLGQASGGEITAWARDPFSSESTAAHSTALRSSNSDSDSNSAVPPRLNANRDSNLSAATATFIYVARRSPRHRNTPFALAKYQRITQPQPRDFVFSATGRTRHVRHGFARRARQKPHTTGRCIVDASETHPTSCQQQRVPFIFPHLSEARRTKE